MFGRSVKAAYALMTAVFLLALLAVPACKGKHNSAPSNVGGGYTLNVSGGTFNDGSGAKGLVILSTLRDSGGNGPGAAGWTLSIEGPGIDQTNDISVTYDDGSSSSYMAWWWTGFDPQSGNYTARASNGTVTLIYAFTIDAQQSLAQPAVQLTNNTASWQEVQGAGSYYYRVSDGWGYLAQSGYIASGSTTSFNIDPGLPDGSYNIEVFAQATDRVALQNDPSAFPALAAQDNISVTSTTIVKGGAGSGYTLNALGGALYMGNDSKGAAMYGLVIWSSILTDIASPTPPASDWTITITGPNIASSKTFTYPRNYSHYVYWDFGVRPGSGAYTILASAPGTTTLSQSFTIPVPMAQLPVTTDISVTQSQGGADLSWSAVTGAASYYVNIWAYVNSVYTEVAGGWVNTLSAVVPKGTLTTGTVYDVYVTACELDMTPGSTSAVPVPAVDTQVNMSDNSLAPLTFTAQ